ncbi:MAG: type I secretion system permease/ATPase [Desulforhopalus sp.]
MREFISRFKVFFISAAGFSFIINMLLLAPSLYMLQVYDRVLSGRSVETLVMMTLLLIVLLLMMGCLEMVRTKLLVEASSGIDDQMGAHVLRRMINNSVSLDQIPYMNGLRDLQLIKQFLTGSGILAFFDAPWLPAYMAILYLMHPIYFVVGILGAIAMLILAILNELSTRTPLEEAGVHGRQASQYIEMSLRNGEVVNAMGMHEGIVSRWRNLNSKVLSQQRKASHRAGAISGSTKFLRQTLQSVMLGIGAYLVLQDQSSAGIMIAATIMFGKAIGPIEHAIGSWKVMIEARSAYGRLDAFLKSLPADVAHMQLPPPEGHISVEHVTFGLRATNKVLLKDISFDLLPGEILGLIGPSAAGKSSLARLLVGVWRPLAGFVRIDGADLTTWRSEDLGQYIGYLPQDVELFAGTIAENIARLGVIDSEAVVKAATLAGVHDLVLHLTDGYDTHIGEGGVVLSGGQRQRIGLARALYGSPRFVVLDEPNANLDAEGEIALNNAIAELKRSGATVVIIAHKISLMASVDKLLVLKDGIQVMYGPREEILIAINQSMKGQPPAANAMKNKVATDKEATVA